MKRYIFLFVSVVMVAFAVFAQEKDEKKEPVASKAEVLAIKDSDFVVGDENAPVTVIEYASLTCSHCASFHNNVYQVFKEKYVDSGKVRFIYRDFPLDGQALHASMIVRCSGKERFENFVKAIFSSQSNWAGKKNYLEILSNIAKLGGMTGAEVDVCVKDKVVETYVLQTRADAAQALEVSSTPNFFINGEKFAKSASLQNLGAVIDPLIEANAGDEG